MSEKILVPELGESITEATVSKWLKNAGDTVETDEPVVELETDKVNLEVPAPVNGIISKINFKNGDTVDVGAILGTISEVKDSNKPMQPIKIEKATIISLVQLNFAEVETSMKCFLYNFGNLNRSNLIFTLPFSPLLQLAVVHISAIPLSSVEIRSIVPSSYSIFNAKFGMFIFSFL